MIDADNHDRQMPDLLALADALPSAMLVINRQGTICLSNTLVATVLGMPGDDRLDGQPMWQALPAGLREMVAAMQREVLIYASDARREFELILADGKRKLLDVHLAPVNGKGGQPEQFCLVLTDATARQEVVELKKLDQLKSNFLAMISHELRTPLTSIRGAVHLLGDNALGAVDPGKALVGIIQGNSERLIRLVNNLLEMVTIDNETFMVSRSMAPVKPLIEQAVAKCEAAVKCKFLQVEYRGQDCVANVDAERFVQFIYYLLDNAVKFTPHGGQIIIQTVCASNGSINVTVSDTGSGVPAFAREKVFDRFYQVEDTMTRCTGGTGVGLYLARHIVQAHGGRIRVRPNTDGGSVFEAEFPAMTGTPAKEELQITNY